MKLLTSRSRDRLIVAQLLPEGYQSRFSDSLNRQEIAFIPVTDVEIAPLGGGEVVRRDFIVLGKAHIRLAFPISRRRPSLQFRA